MTDRTTRENQSDRNTTLYDDDHTLQPQERTPLIGGYASRRRCYETIWLACLALILIVGVSIGAYLLSVEGGSDIPEKFLLVLRREWTTEPTVLNITRLSLPSPKVLLMQTNTRGCWSRSECIEELRSIQKQHMEQLNEPDITYNFVVAGDGRVYEGRGWDYQSCYADTNRELLAIAFLGTYDDVAPTDQQTEELKAFLDYAVMRDILVPCYNIVVRSSPSRYLLDIAFNIEENVKKGNEMC